jgi:hypothetical protein
MTNYLDKFNAQTLPKLAQCIVVSGESLRFTAVGRQRYAERFARAGIDISTIRTLARLRNALEDSADTELKAFADYVKAKHPPGDERDWLIAVAIGSEGEIAALAGRIARRNRHGVRIVKDCGQSAR